MERAVWLVTTVLIPLDNGSTSSIPTTIAAALALKIAIAEKGFSSMKDLYVLVRRRPIAPSPWHFSKLFHPCLLLSHFLKNGHPGQVKVSRDDPRRHTGANSTSFPLTVIRHHPAAD